jgi:1,4-alpha-glucan branching enzyme
MNKLLPLLLFLYFVFACAAKQRGPELLDAGVRFTVSAPTAVSVSIIGSFNRWDPRRNMLSGPDEGGIWSIVLCLLPGRYEYLFVINGNERRLDPFAVEVDDGMGGKNSVVFVTQERSKP